MKMLEDELLAAAGAVAYCLRVQVSVTEMVEFVTAEAAAVELVRTSLPGSL